jgi:nuclear pore complex protein Nup133
MSQRCRQRLATDAEKLHACHQLWLQHNHVLAYVIISRMRLNLVIHLKGSTGHTHSILNEAVYTYMNERGEGNHEDVMRAFFRHHVGSIGELLPPILEIMERPSHGSGRSLSVALPEANSIVLVSFLCWHL